MVTANQETWTATSGRPGVRQRHRGAPVRPLQRDRWRSRPPTPRPRSTWRGAVAVATFHLALREGAAAVGRPRGRGGRLQGTADVTCLPIVANPADTKTANAPYELFGPGDVKRLAAGAITRRFPAPGASNAEETKLALVEFAAHGSAVALHAGGRRCGEACGRGSCWWWATARPTRSSCGRTVG